MRKITLCLAYYENPNMLKVQYDALAELPAVLKENLRLIVVDDGSPTKPAYPPPEDIGVSVEIYRAREDIPWNQDWARNLAVSRAKTNWVLLTDMDHVPTHDLYNRIICDERFMKDCIYTFGRVSAPELLPYKPHPNSWFMTVEMYNNIGGYDERFRGVYGTDGDFRYRAARSARKINACKEFLIRYPREVIADASTSTLVRRSPENEELRREVRAKIRASGTSAPKRFLTEWDQIA